MSRIAKIAREDWAPELAMAYGDQDASELQLGLLRMFAHKPAAAAALIGFMGALRQSRELTDRLTELVRLRIAYHNQCRSCMAVRYRDADGVGIDEGLVCSLERPMEAPNLTAAERAALAYADRFATDHLSIDDATYDGLRDHFTEAQIVELGMICLTFVGVGRLGATWDMLEELPDAYRDRSTKIAPWANAPVAMKG
jgi:AhpD family alkylhydroperoxidase